MLTITILDGDAAIATADVEPDLDENGEDTGQHSPFVDFRVIRYSLLPAFDQVRPFLRAAGEATLAIGRRRNVLSEAERGAALSDMKVGKAIEGRLAIRDQSGGPIEGRITMFRETDFGDGPLHAIGVVLAEQYVEASSRTQPNERCS
jgi:hypothetical protein